MRWFLVAAFSALLIVPLACNGGDDEFNNKAQCADGKDNDGDGMVDFPDDLGCDNDGDDSEDSMPSPLCKDGRDNDGDGKIDFPLDPGCFAPQQNTEDDDCPDGPNCPQCANGKDDDANGTTDYPGDSGGCTSASDTDEYTQNPVACGAAVQIKKLPFDGHATGMLMAGSPSNLMSPMCGGAGVEDVYELRVMSPKVVVATTDLDGTATTNTVLYIRGAACSDNASEMACNDDVATTNRKSTVTKPISQPGTYYLVVDARDATGGPYELSVRFMTGEGEPCSGADDCGPGLVCRIPYGQATKVCAKHVCEDSIDDDMDGKNGYPLDPGCTSPTDDDETDSCPGAGCPECGDGVDNDGDTKIDYGQDTTCKSAADASEACVTSEGVETIIAAATTGTTVGAVNDVTIGNSCSSTTNTAPDKVYRIDVPTMSTLTIDNVNTFDASVAVYNSTCAGTPVACDDEPETLTLTNLAAGAYYYVVDGYSSSSGTYTINVSGKIENGQPCEGVLATAGAITCNTGYACKGTTGSKTCQPAKCSDGLDGDADGKIDYPNDPGCTGPDDDTETDPATAPVCANSADDDGDSMTDWPADFGCVAASGTSEAFCTGEMDPPSLITTKTTTGTTMGKSNDWAPTCQTTSSAPDITYALQLPVPVVTLDVDTIGSGFDTVLMMRNTQCTTQLGCDDDSGGSFRSKITLSNVAPGGYSITVDGYSSNNGMTTLNVHGVVATGTKCGSPLFSGGAAAVLSCPTGTTCTGSPAKCQ